MAEKETREGKDLALDEKIKMQIEQAEKDEKGNVVENPTIEIGNLYVEIDVEKIEKRDAYKIQVLGVHILTLDENNELSFKEGWEDKLREQLNNNDEKVNGEDLIKSLKEMQLKLEKEKQEKEENQKDEKDLSDDKEEKEEDEPEEKEEKTEDEEKNKIARRHHVNPNQVVHVSMDKRITDNDNFKGLATWAKDYDDIYILPGKDEYSWETVGIDKDGEEQIINNKQREGKNPDVTIKRVDGKEITEVRPVAMYEIDSKQYYAVIRDTAGKTQMLYCRQEEGNGKAFWGIGVPEADGKNVLEKSVEGREFIDAKNNSSYDLAKKGTALEIGADLEERGIPSQEEGVQTEEIEGTPKQNRQLRKEDIIEDLLKRDGIVDRAKAMPGFYENKAEKVLQLMETNDKITYDDAVKQVENSNRQPGGKTPDERPNKREH